MESEQTVKVFWLLREHCVDKDGSTDFKDFAYRWNTYISEHHGQACSMVNAQILEQFETKLCKRQKESQSLAHAQVLSGEKMMGHQHGLIQGGKRGGHRTAPRCVLIRTCLLNPFQLSILHQILLHGVQKQQKVLVGEGKVR